jgi:hypothetical protein
MVETRRFPATPSDMHNQTLGSLQVTPNAGLITGYRTLFLTEHNLHSEVHCIPEQAHKSNSKHKCQGKPETKVDKHHGNQHAKFSNQGPDQTDDTWPDQRARFGVRGRAVSSSQPKTSRHETSPTSTDNQFVTLDGVASLTSS